MAPDRMQQTRDAITAAVPNGWNFIGYNTVQRMVEHPTPQFAKDAGWWTDETYTSLQLIRFVFGIRHDRVPKVWYTVSHTSWTGATETVLTFTQALKLLAEPLEQSAVHDR